MDLKTYLRGKPRGAGADLAAKAGIHRVLLSQWIGEENPRAVPAEHCPTLERITLGEVVCEEVRPDVRWHRVPDAAWPHPLGRPLIDVSAPLATEAASVAAAALHAIEPAQREPAEPVA